MLVLPRSHLSYSLAVNTVLPPCCATGCRMVEYVTPIKDPEVIKALKIGV